MGKGWIHTATGIALLGGVVFGSVHYDEYVINGNRVKDGHIVFNDLIEYKGEDQVRYVMSFKNEDLGKVVINGKGFDKKDTLVYEEAARRYNSLKEQIEDAKNQFKDSGIEKKLVPEEKLTKKAVPAEMDKETEEALEILRK